MAYRFLSSTTLMMLAASSLFMGFSTPMVSARRNANAANADPLPLPAPTDSLSSEERICQDVQELDFKLVPSDLTFDEEGDAVMTEFSHKSAYSHHFQKRTLFESLPAEKPVHMSWLETSLEVLDRDGDRLTDDLIRVRVGVKNNGGEMVHLLKRGTPFSGADEDAFSVTRGTTQSPVTFLGITLKSGAPSIANYLSLGPQETHFVDIDLASRYAMNIAGTYTIKVSLPVMDYFVGSISELEERLEFFLESYNDGPVPSHFASDLKLESNAVTVNIVANSMLAPAHRGHDQEVINKLPKTHVGPLVITYGAKCSEDDKKFIVESAKHFNKMIKLTQHRINKKRHCGPLFRRFFGHHTDQTRTEGNYQIVAESFHSLHETHRIHFACHAGRTCSIPGVYAYVRPVEKFNQIFVCNTFFESTAGTGYNTGAGTILHELSHFDRVVGTDDVCYGVDKCEMLARRMPGYAVKNADSYEFYAEALYTALQDAERENKPRPEPTPRKPRKPRTPAPTEPAKPDGGVKKPTRRPRKPRNPLPSDE